MGDNASPIDLSYVSGQLNSSTQALRSHVELANTLAGQLAELHAAHAKLGEQLLSQPLGVANGTVESQCLATAVDQSKPDVGETTVAGVVNEGAWAERRALMPCHSSPNAVRLDQTLDQSFHRQLSPSRPRFNVIGAAPQTRWASVGDVPPATPRGDPRINCLGRKNSGNGSSLLNRQISGNTASIASPRNLNLSRQSSPMTPRGKSSHAQVAEPELAEEAQLEQPMLKPQITENDSDILSNVSPITPPPVELEKPKRQSSAESRERAARERRSSLFNYQIQGRYSTSNYRTSVALRTAGLKLASSSEWVVNPEQSRALEKWDMITMFSLFFVALVTPVQISLTTCTLECPVLFAINSVIDFIFLADLILQFFLMYPKKTNFGYALEYRHKHIVMNYLKTWFSIDLLSIIPFDLMSALSNSEKMSKMKSVKVIRLMRLLKLVRVLKASRLFRRFEVRMSFTYQRLALLKFFVVLAALTHWMACLWALTLMLVDDDSGVPRWVDTFDEQEANVVYKTKDSIWKTYIACLYFTSYTITSVGYGDIGPQNIVERIACTIIILLSGISWAMVLGQVCGIVGTMDADEQHFRKTMDDLNFMMNDRQIPKMMCRRLRSFFLANKLAERHKQQRQLLDSMSPGLQGEVLMEMNKIWLSQVSFLNALLVNTGDDSLAGMALSEYLHSFVHDVAREVQYVVYAQREYFGMYQILYILNQGLVSRRRTILRAGAVWGTDFLLSDLSLHHSPRSFTLTYVTVMVLARGNFLEILDKFTEECPEVVRRVRRYVCWLAVQRGIMAEAQRRIAANTDKEKLEMLGAAEPSKTDETNFEKQRLTDLERADAISNNSDSYSI